MYCSQHREGMHTIAAGFERQCVTCNSAAGDRIINQRGDGRDKQPVRVTLGEITCFDCRKCVFYVSDCCFEGFRFRTYPCNWMFFIA